MILSWKACTLLSLWEILGVRPRFDRSMRFLGWEARGVRDSFYLIYPLLLSHPYSIFYHLYSILYPNLQSLHPSNLHYHHPHPLASSTPSQIERAIHNLLHKGESINLRFFIEFTRDPLPQGSYDDFDSSRRGQLHLLNWLIAPSCVEVFWL